MIRTVCFLLVAVALCAAASRGEALPADARGPVGTVQTLDVVTTLADGPASELASHNTPLGPACGRLACVGDSFQSPSVMLRQMPEPAGLLLLSAGFAILSRSLRQRPTRP
jgi:hypothetical protein